MTYVILTIVGIISLVLIFQFYLIRRSRKIVGVAIDLNQLPAPLRKMLDKRKTLVYFYSPSCGPCKVQAPVIDRLKRELKNVVSVDISGDFRIARVFGVIGTPSTIIFENGIIKEMFVGVKGEEILKNAFNKI